MPAKPLWIAQLALVRQQLSPPTPNSAQPFWLDRRRIEELLGVGRRRAQQILSACATAQTGRSLLVDRDSFLAYLEASVQGEAADWEESRRKRLALRIESWRKEFLERPPVLVEAPARIRNTRLDSLPEGISLERQQLILRFENQADLLRKLLALAIALGQEEITIDDLPTPEISV